MKGFKQIALVLICLIPMLSCENDTAPSAPVDFQFKLLNGDKNSSVSFNQGENFVFSFIMINRSNEDIYFKQSSLQTTEFLKVYLTNTNEANPIIFVGKPYKSLFCMYQNGVIIPAKDTLKLEIPWIPSTDGCCAHFCLVENNSPLPQGKYSTGFSSAFEFIKGDKSYKTEAKSFKIDFEVKWVYKILI